MTKVLTTAVAQAYQDADVENLIPEGEYTVKITAIDQQENNPERLCFQFKVLGGEYKGRKLRAWPSTAPELIWTLKKLIGEVVVDPFALEWDDLQSHIFKAEVTVEVRKDNGEKTNRVLRLLPSDDDVHVDDDDEVAGGDEDMPF